MTRFVLDCFMTMVWCFEDEVEERAESILNSLFVHEVIVPNIWPVEVANVLAVCERRKRVNAMKIEAFVNTLRSFPIQIDDQTSKRAFGEVLALARTHRLTAYDAAYLELAMRTGSPLASLDVPLNAVAVGLGVPLFDG